MIVRIMGEGQLRVDDEQVDHLNSLDDTLQARVDDGDEDGFRRALAALLAQVRGIGERLPDDELVASDAVVPSEDATLADVRELLSSSDEGLIPG